MGTDAGKRRRVRAGRRRAPGSPRGRLRLALSAAFLVTVASLVATTGIPLVATGAQVRELIRVGDDHAEAVEVLERLRGRLAAVRTTLFEVAMRTGTAGDRDLGAALDSVRDAAREFRAFADTRTERTGIEEVRADVARCSAGAERIRDGLRAGGDAAAQVPWVIGEIDAADAVAQRLVTFNAAQVQESSRRVRESLWRVAAISAVLAALGLGAALVLVQYARAGFARYSAAVESRAEEMAAFAGRAAHELRSPLHSVALALAVLGQEPGRADAVARADAGVRRLRATIDKLLEFAAAGGRPPPGSSCEVAPVVDEAVAELAPALADARVERDVDPSLRVGVDAAHLRTVVSNLVANAAKYGRNGAAPRIRISAGRREGWIELAVADEGPGIPEAALPRVFEPLFRASSTPGGYGLGLATTKRLVEAHGGTIAIRAAEPHGTVVRVRLPALAP